MNYFWLTLKHKWFVFLAGLKTKAPLYNLIVHDWTKLTPAELPHYQRQFFGDKGDPEGFNRAWVHHQNANPHHWEYWISRMAHNRGGDKEKVRVCAHQPEIGPYQIFYQDREICEVGTWGTLRPGEDSWEWYHDATLIEQSLKATTPLPMPEKYVREMVADWMGAGRAYTGSWDDLPKWLEQNAEKMILHPKTVVLLWGVLSELGVPVPRVWQIQDLESWWKPDRKWTGWKPLHVAEEEATSSVPAST